MGMWKKIWEWVGHISIVQWLLSLMFPGISTAAILNIVANVPPELSIIYGFFAGLACFMVWHTAQWMKRQSQITNETPILLPLADKNTSQPNDAPEYGATNLPDFALSELLDRIFALNHFVDDGSLESLDKIRGYGQEICDALSLRNLSAWGRMSGGSLERLPIWVSRKGFGLGRNSIGEIVHLLQYTDDNGIIVNVTDFRFLREEIDEVWPDE